MLLYLHLLSSVICLMMRFSFSYSKIVQLAMFSSRLSVSVFYGICEDWTIEVENDNHHYPITFSKNCLERFTMESRKWRKMFSKHGDNFRIYVTIDVSAIEYYYKIY